MPLFRVTFEISLLVEAEHGRGALIDGRCALPHADAERLGATVNVEPIESASALTSAEARSHPWGARGPRRCGEIAAESDRGAGREPPPDPPEQGHLFREFG